MGKRIREAIRSSKVYELMAFSLHAPEALYMYVLFKTLTQSYSIFSLNLFKYILFQL